MISGLLFLPAAGERRGGVTTVNGAGRVASTYGYTWTIQELVCATALISATRISGFDGTLRSNGVSVRLVCLAQ